MNLFKKERHIVIDKYHHEVQLIENDKKYGTCYVFPSFIQTETDGSITIILDKPLHVLGGIHSDLDIRTKCDLFAVGSIRSSLESITILGDLETKYNDDAPNLLGEDPGHIKAQKDLIVNGNVEAEGMVEVKGDVKIDGNLWVAHTSNIGGDLLVEGNCEIGNKLSVGGDLHIKGSLRKYRGYRYLNNGKINVMVNGNIYIDGNVSLPGEITCKGKIEIKGDRSCDA